MPRIRILNTRRALMVAALMLLGTGPRALPALAGVDGDLRAGLNVDPGLFTIGGGLLLDISRQGRWYFNPNLEAGLESDNQGQRLSLNGDFHYDFARTGNTSVYMGAGAAWLSRDTYEDAGLNLFLGCAGGRGEVRPFAQFKGVVADENEVVLMGGVRF